MEIFIDNEEIDVSNIHLTKFENYVFEKGKKINDVEWDFSSISRLKGNKDILEMSFEAELKEQLFN
jgi:hypothetical protein